MHTKLSQSTAQWQEYPEYGLGFPLLQDPSINKLVLDNETVLPFTTKPPNKQDSDRVASNLRKKAFQNDVPADSVTKLQQLWDQIASEKTFDFYWSNDLWNYGLTRKNKNATQAIEAFQQRQQKEGKSKLKLSNKTIKRMQHMKPINKPSTWLAGDTALFLTPLEDAHDHSFWLAQICGFDDFHNPKKVTVYWLEATRDYGRYYHCKIDRGSNSFWRDVVKIETIIAVFKLTINNTIPEPVAAWIKYNVLRLNPERLSNIQPEGRRRPPEDVSAVATSRANVSIILDENENEDASDNESCCGETSIQSTTTQESLSSSDSESDQTDEVAPSVTIVEGRTQSGLLSLARLHPTASSINSSTQLSTSSSSSSAQVKPKRQQAKRQQAKRQQAKRQQAKPQNSKANQDSDRQNSNKRKKVSEQDGGWRVAAFNT